MDLTNAGEQRRRIFGVVTGIVTDNQHPEGEYRVKVTFPWIRSASWMAGTADSEDFISSWARISTVMAGLGRGMWLLPEIEDEVLVMFEHGDPRRPIVIGTVWNGKDVPPVGDKAPKDSTDPQGLDLAITKVTVDTKKGEKKNNARFFYSRSGHLLLFDDDKDGTEEKIVLKTARGHTLVLNDKSGKESIAIYDSKGEEYIVLDEAKKKIIIETKNGSIDVFCKNGTFNLEAKDIKTKASNTITHESSAATKNKSGSTYDVESSGNTTVKAAKIDLNP